MTPEEIWVALGGRGATPPRLGAFSGKLLVLGGASCVWEDFGKLRPWGGEIMCVNDVGAHLHDTVSHWVTLHPEYMKGWRFFREKHLYGKGVPVRTHSNKHKDGIDEVWNVDNLGGTSGLFACFVGLMLGYEEIVVAGIPMTNGGHYFDPPWQHSENGDKCALGIWRWARDNIFQGRVKSMSGNTKDILGQP